MPATRSTRPILTTAIALWLTNVFAFTAFTAATNILGIAVEASMVPFSPPHLILSLFNAALALAAAIALLRSKPATKPLLARITIDTIFLVLAITHPAPQADVGPLNAGAPLFATLLLLTDAAATLIARNITHRTPAS